MIKSGMPNRLVLFTAALLALISVATCWAGDSAQQARILVTGQGSVDVAPDMAMLSLTVTREAETAREALDANSSAMQDVLAAMRSEGIDGKDLQTSNFSIQPNYVYPQPRSSGEREPPRIVGYTVRNSLTVRVRDISSLGRILDKSVTLGVNEGGNITFTNDDPSEAITMARVLAMKDAMKKAGTLAEAGGVELGRLLEISEQSFNPRPMPMAKVERTMAMSADAVPMARGENTYSVSVNVTYAIEQ